MLISIVCILGIVAVVYFVQYRMNLNFQQAFKKTVIQKQYSNEQSQDNFNLSYLLLGTAVFGNEFNDLITTSKISALEHTSNSTVLFTNSSCGSGDSSGASCGSSCGGCGGGD